MIQSRSLFPGSNTGTARSETRGSLCRQVPAIVPSCRETKRPLLIVPGGGPFANAVREIRVDGDAAHWMAIAAMEQYGWYIASYGIPSTGALAIPDRPTVLLPYRCMREHDPLPHSWDVTSDTIAAWVAGMLGLDLLLLKSVDGYLQGRNSWKPSLRHS